MAGTVVAVGGAAALTGWVALTEWQQSASVHAFHVHIGDDRNHGLHPPHYHWEHKGMFKTFDHAAYQHLPLIAA